MSVPSETIAGTGHRPESCKGETQVRLAVHQVFEEFPNATFITGCTAGFDLWAADVALDLGIPVIAARPWATHRPRKADASLYAKVIEGAREVVVVTEAEQYPGPWVYHKRNEWMVDHADRVLAYWSGKERGGTYECIRYARKMKRPVRNIYG